MRYSQIKKRGFHPESSISFFPLLLFFFILGFDSLGQLISLDLPVERVIIFIAHLIK